ncbi:MAG: fructose 1,6-bisphosphatase [Desulfobacterales bacterium]|nr:fructose 1,6-bisphosphatase [Desulfobacterales bacterium]
MTKVKFGPLNPVSEAGSRDMFDDPSFDVARQECNRLADHMRRHGPFEPHRLPMEEMEYTTMPQVMERLESWWEDLN